MEKPREYDYEVFLSFRGPDTRLDIADYLYTSLVKAGIKAYRDNEKLPIGEDIGPELLQAIQRSEILIPILSKGYAVSPWCLMELVHMVECKENWGRKIMPIFYDIAPSAVLRQTESYGEAINSHINKGRYADETIQNWKAALSKVGALRGWELKDRGKGKFTEEVVRTLLIELRKNYLAISNYLVEMDDHVDKIMEVIGEQTTETKIVGIYGMGGVGKTTLATIIYNKLSADSTSCCFLSNFKDTKIEILQDQLISGILKETCLPIRNRAEGITEIKKRLSSTKVILVLDDVVQKTQLDALVGMGQCWFDNGSKVIITTRNKEVLKDVDLKHELIEMDFDHSCQLFSRHAFRRDDPPAEYVSLSEEAVKICGCLPLALEIIGSFLAGKDKNCWVATLEKLRTIPDKDVKEKLNISIGALEHRAREIFLDICCFFIGHDVRVVRHMWESCGFFPDYHLEVLQHMSLIKIKERKQLWMHDLLRDIGRDYVCENGNLKPEKQSRVWDHKQANDVLVAKEADNVEAIRLKFDHQFQDYIEKGEPDSLSNLRFLEVDCVELGENKIHHFPSTDWFQRYMIMLPKLKWLSWHNFPIFFKLTTFSLRKLLILDLSWSEITDDWEGWNHLKKAKNLKVLNLTRCRNLLKTPNFSAHKNLEQLILQGCEKLIQVDGSIGELKHLVLLNLGGCRKLRTLPDEMEKLEALTELLVDATSLTNIPEWKGMKKLETLSASSCTSLSICNFAGCLTSLSKLRLEATKITELPFGKFGSLVELNLSWSEIQELPNSIEKMKNLRVLRMSYTHLKKLPSALGMLEKLEEIDAHGCRELCGEIPSEIGRLPFLRILTLMDTSIIGVPELPESVTHLYLTISPMKRYPDLSNLLNLRVLELKLKSTSLIAGAPSLNWIRGIRKLESLLLHCDSLAALPSDLNLLSKLQKLDLVVNNLKCLPRLPQNLSNFRIYARKLTEKSIDLSYLEKLSELEVCNCELLTEIEGLERLENLKRLCLGHLPSLVNSLPDLTNLKKLAELWIRDCPKLVGVRGQLESLKNLRVMSCKSLEKLPDPSSFKHMRTLFIDGCRKLKEIQGLEDSENLRELSVADLPLLEKLPDLTKPRELKVISLKDCPGLVEIRGRLESLERLRIERCRFLLELSDPSSFNKLELLEINDCEMLEQTLKSVEYRHLRKVTRVSGKPATEIPMMSRFHSPARWRACSGRAAPARTHLNRWGTVCNHLDRWDPFLRNFDFFSFFGFLVYTLLFFVRLFHLFSLSFYPSPSSVFLPHQEPSTLSSAADSYSRGALKRPRVEAGDVIR